LIKNPRILLLDEATSALDTESERLVQEALDKAATNRTSSNSNDDTTVLIDEKKHKLHLRKMSTRGSTVKSLKNDDEIKKEEMEKKLLEKMPLARVFKMCKPEYGLMFIGCIGSGTGERLTKRLRRLTFEALLNQEIAYFDDEKNGTGVLTSKLAVDATKVEGLSGSLMATVLQNCFNLAVGFTRAAYEGTGQIVQQSVSNMRTIAALTREETFKTVYQNAIREPHKIAIKGSLLSSFGFGTSQGILYFIWSLSFWYGAQLIKADEYDLQQMLRVMFAVVFTAVSLGQMSTFAPDVAKAKVAALSIFEILDRKSHIDPTDNEGKDRPAPVLGDTSFHSVHFNYPARPNVPILRGLDLSIYSGKTIALVGSSGSGKSTVVSLLLRFYDVNSGEVEVEGVNVKQWNLEYLRANMALVGQEPVLFDLTIAENIAYGKEGCSTEEIEEAAKEANIHNFITALPDGYNTRVGEKGTQLSGGQKQVNNFFGSLTLIRSPKILLLDEATSALDSESEKVVQNALNKASKAHRLSTIQNADLILVCKKGKVVETGKHFDLISQKGLYYELVNKQTLIKKND
ncbi:15060_t:CDS:2, partial [Racocetra fulgida]